MSLRPVYSITNERLRSLRSLQELVVRLYFDDKLQLELRENTASLVTRFGIADADVKFLPDVANEDFLAECWGRRIMVAREISKRFERFLGALAIDLAKSDLFREFIASDAFLKSNSSMEHAYGIGLGYENVSKFFIWTISSDYVRDPSIRNALMTDFSAHLLSTSRHSLEPVFQSMKSAIVFQDNIDPGMMFVVATGRVLRTYHSTLSKAFDLTEWIQRRRWLGTV